MATERPGLGEKISEITFSFIARRPSTTKFEGDVNGSSDVLFLSSWDEKTWNAARFLVKVSRDRHNWDFLEKVG